MKNTKKVLPFPKIADRNIEWVFTEFLKEQQRRLKARTYHQYEEVIGLLRHCLNCYGYHDLDNSSDVALYERFYFQRNLEFCVIFGADKILPSFNTFLNYFMIRKVMASETLLQATGTVSKKLIRWLEERQYVDKAQASEATVIAAEAAKELPAVERLARLIYEYSQSHAPRFWTSELDDYFTIEKVRSGALLLAGGSSSGLLEVRVPKEITDHCRVGWQINLLLGKTRNGWCILETGSVYPS